MSKFAIVQLLAAREAQMRLQFRTRAGLEHHQRQQMVYLFKHVLPASPYYKVLLSKPFTEWPMMNARLLAKYFDIINTQGAKRTELLAQIAASQNGDAQDAAGENYMPVLSRNGNTLLLFDAQERLQRLGALLAALDWQHHDAPLNLAYFFHTDYLGCGSIVDKHLRIECYDLNHSYAELCAQLTAQQPDTIIAPCTLLLRLFEDIQSNGLNIGLPRVYNSGEVLTRRDRLKLRTLFPYVGDVYLTAEAFVGISCSHGRLHINENNILIQYENLEGNRFLPVISVLQAHVTPLVQYRMNDIVVLDNKPCPCGSVHQVVKHVEGCLEDILLLPGEQGQRIRIYPDMCHNILLKTLPRTSCYQLVQLGPRQLELRAAAEKEEMAEAHLAMFAAWRSMGVDTGSLSWRARQVWGEHNLGEKRRQIMRV